jgi:hypothetical protein
VQQARFADDVTAPLQYQDRAFLLRGISGTGQCLVNPENQIFAALKMADHASNMTDLCLAVVKTLPWLDDFEGNAARFDNACP